MKVSRKSNSNSSSSSSSETMAGSKRKLAISSYSTAGSSVSASSNSRSRSRRGSAFSSGAGTVTADQFDTSSSGYQRQQQQNYTSILYSIVDTFERNANPAVAPGMRAYMRDQWDYYGLQKPMRAELSKGFLKDLCALNLCPADIAEVVVFLWSQSKRECAYVAIDYISKLPKTSKFWSAEEEMNSLQLLEYMMVTNSWWDSVDIIASTFVGRLFELSPQLVRPTLEKWDMTSNIWLQRASIIYQLKYKHRTDESVLFHQCELHMQSEEFFLQKSIGWALREYAKTNSLAVKNFLMRNSSQMSSLSIREASKYL